MKIIIVLFLVFKILAFSADINTTLVNGNEKTYTELLNTIKQNKTSNEEQNLQKTLLQKLLLTSVDNKPTKIKKITVTNQQDYKKLFNSYLEQLLSIKNLQNSIQNNKEKVKILEAQIHGQENLLLTTQLFYSLYTKNYKFEEIKLISMQKELSQIETNLLNSLPKISFDKKQIDVENAKLQTQLEQILKQIERLKIKKERYQLLDETASLSKIENLIEKKSLQEKALYKKKLLLLFLDFSLEIQNKKDNIIKEHKQILSLLHEHISDGNLIIDEVDNFLTNMEQSILGTVGTLKAKGLEEFKREVKNLWKISNQSLFTINKTPISALKLLLSLFILFIGFLIGSGYKKYIKSFNLKNKTMSASTHTLLANMGYYVIFIITFFIVLKVIGIDLSSIALVAGALSVGIGFGLQNIISNFVSGIILMVERSVKIGDYIELDDNLRGHVVDIKMRSITVNTNSNIDIIVPNQDLIQNRVINWTMNDKIRRFEIPFGVAYGTQPQKVISVILEAIQKSDSQDIYTTQERHTRVVMTGMGDSSVNFELFIWIKGKEILFPKRTISRFLVLVYNALYANNIEIPFPQQDLHIRSVDKEILNTLQRRTTNPSL